MIKEIDINLLKDNNFNPKNPFNEDEYKLLKKSLSKWGFKGILLVVPDYNENGKYIVIDGNTRYKTIKQKTVLCEIIQGIKNDNDLKELTIDFCGAIKNRNYNKLLNLYQETKNNLDDDYHNLFNKIKINIEKYKKEQEILKSFDKTVLLKFGEKEAYEKFEIIKKNIKRKLYKNAKFLESLEQLENEINDNIIDKHIVDIILRIAGK